MALKEFNPNDTEYNYAYFVKDVSLPQQRYGDNNIIYEITLTGKNISTNHERTMLVVGAGSDFMATKIARALRPWQEGENVKWHSTYLKEQKLIEKGDGFITWRFHIVEPYLD